MLPSLAIFSEPANEEFFIVFRCYCVLHCFTFFSLKAQLQYLDVFYLHVSLHNFVPAAAQYVIVLIYHPANVSVKLKLDTVMR